MPLARIGQYHLFRLPTADEIAIRDWLRQPAGAEALRRLADLPSQDRLKALTELAAGESAAAAQGPVNCGPVSGLRRKGTIQKICAAYVAGFANGAPVYPYLEGARE